MAQLFTLALPLAPLAIEDRPVVRIAHEGGAYTLSAWNHSWTHCGDQLVFGWVKGDRSVADIAARARAHAQLLLDMGGAAMVWDQAAEGGHS
jgi:hypothetical protein